MLRHANSPTDNEKREALSRLLDDSHLEGADRLRAFLRYIVEEELAGRGADIRGKTIAQDVYGRDTSEGTDPENVVRVDARRLRQLLELYYETAGKHDPVRLYMDSGGYRPRFESVRPAHSLRHSGWPVRFGVPIGVFAAGSLIGAIIGANLLTPEVKFTPSHSDTASASENPNLLQRAAIYEKSPAALQAFNLAQQARAMIFF